LKINKIKITIVGGIMRSQKAKILKIYIINLLSNIRNMRGGKLIDIAVALKLIIIVEKDISSNSFKEIFIFLKESVSKKYGKFIFELIKKVKI